MDQELYIRPSNDAPLGGSYTEKVLKAAQSSSIAIIAFRALFIYFPFFSWNLCFNLSQQAPFFRAHAAI
jgi:hypothetical protein